MKSSFIVFAFLAAQGMAAPVIGNNNQSPGAPGGPVVKGPEAESTLPLPQTPESSSRTSGGPATKDDGASIDDGLRKRQGGGAFFPGPFSPSGTSGTRAPKGSEPNFVPFFPGPPSKAGTSGSPAVGGELSNVPFFPGPPSKLGTSGSPAVGESGESPSF